jgi:periplasmic protein TonB
MFETTLVASRQTSTLRNPKLLPVAILAHGLLLAGVVTASYWNVEEVAEPDTYNIIPLALGPDLPAPEPPPAPPAPQPPTAPVAPPVATPVDVPPVSVDDIPPTPLPVDAPISSEFAGPVSDQPATPSSGGPVCPGCIGTGPNDGTGITHVLPGMTPPEAITRVMPLYTEPARRARIQGVVILEATIGADGNVYGARILKSLPMGLDQQAIDAVQRWKFRPARYGQQPRSVYFTLTIRFELQ